MKNILLILAIAYSSASFAQGNLQFNQVLNITGEAPGGNVFTTVTVPVGKVWKITSSSWMEDDGDDPYASYTSLCIGQFKLATRQGNDAVFPIWLNEGDHDVKYCSTTTTIASKRYAISGIEFNIIP
jgi:hypothetical protein